MTDERLAEQARLGSGAAFSALVARHGDAVYRIARNLCTGSSAAEEATRQAFLSAHRELAARPAGARVSNWLYRIAVRTALAQRERSSRSGPAVSLDLFLPRFDEKGDLAAPAATAAGPPERDLRAAAAGDGLAAAALCGSRAEDWPEPGAGGADGTVGEGLLREALDSIDDGVRAAFVLCDLVDVPAEDAAEILQSRPDVVRRRVHRARLMLRGFLDRRRSA